MKLSVTAKQSPTLATQLRARTAKQIAKVRVQSKKSADRAFLYVQELVPRASEYMAEHTRIFPLDGWLGYTIGWRYEDFVGQTNPVTEKVITSFYPVYVVYGTRYMAGRDPLTPALQAERPTYRRAVARALSGD